jgi:hypothetical protein
MEKKVNFKYSNGGTWLKLVRGGRGAGFGMAAGQQGGAATRIAPYLPGLILVRG